MQLQLEWLFLLLSSHNMPINNIDIDRKHKTKMWPGPYYNRINLYGENAKTFVFLLSTTTQTFVLNPKVEKSWFYLKYLLTRWMHSATKEDELNRVCSKGQLGNTSSCILSDAAFLNLMKNRYFTIVSSLCSIDEKGERRPFDFLSFSLKSFLFLIILEKWFRQRMV